MFVSIICVVNYEKDSQIQMQNAVLRCINSVANDVNAGFWQAYVLGNFRPSKET